MIILKKELFGIGNNIKGHEKEEGGAGKLQQLLFDDMSNLDITRTSPGRTLVEFSNFPVITVTKFKTLIHDFVMLF